ncbi:SGT1-domain-containing protein [Amylocystis lapponica]|nr:SGT1-domain-containing protein [Amylocystis lapponica]
MTARRLRSLKDVVAIVDGGRGAQIAHGHLHSPPAISEDTLQYTLYPQSTVSDRASATTLAALMHAHADALLPNHIWHRDAFELKVVMVLEGRMRVGDCVDDEWCAVWLLKEISAKWDVVISVFDSDGEFLLIEAAEALPSWVTPSNAENRVWIYASHLHLVPPSHVSAPSSKPRRHKYYNAQESDDEGDVADDEDFLTAEDSLKLVRDPSVDTTAPPDVEKLVWQRISGYPSAARQHVHTTSVYIPVDIAKALSVDPSLVQKPVETFYTRDALQLRAVHRMSRFPPQPSVLTTVKMTRTAYAQLVGQKFHPPKIFGRWQEREGTSEWRWRDVGMKLACGFEMLYQESKSRTDTAVSAETLKASVRLFFFASGFRMLNVFLDKTDARKDALRRNPDYKTYIQNLVSSGYFKGELEGSKYWCMLEDKAAAAFIEARRDDDASRPSFTAAFNAALSQAGDAPSVPTQHEDSDDWLNVNAEDFDEMLEKTLGNKAKSPPQASSDAMNVDQADNAETEEDKLAKEQASRLQDLAKKVEEFVEGEGDVEGARFADEELSDEEFSDDGSSMSETSDEPDAETSRVSARTDSELAARQTAMDKLVPALDPSDYGKMPPSFHSNSQRVTPITMETEVREDVPAKTPSTSTEQPCIRPIRPPILPRDNYDGVDSDDETDSDDVDLEDDEDEEDQPQVVGDIEIDMAEEQDEFLEFARQALGMSDEQWGNIVRERKDRGAFVPAHVGSESKSQSRAQPRNQSSSSTEGTTTATADQQPSRRTPAPGPRPNVNPSLDSFEAVMQAMDAELARSRTDRRQAPLPSQTSDKGKAKASEVTINDESDTDIERAMDAELRAALEKEQDADEDKDDSEPEMDYNLVKNFLESFKSQAGLSGPVSNMVGRLQQGWTLPRDDS